MEDKTTLEDIRVDISSNIYNNPSNSVYIHFDTTVLCNQFKNWYDGELGHTCCAGKGCLLKNIESNDDMLNIRNKFINQCKGD